MISTDRHLLRLVIRAESLILVEIDAFLIPRFHTGQGLLKRGNHLMMARHKLADILRNDQLRLRNRNGKFNQDFCSLSNLRPLSCLRLCSERAQS